MSEVSRIEVVQPSGGVALAMAEAWKTYLEGVLSGKVTDEDRKGWLQFSLMMGTPVWVVNPKEAQHE